MSLTVSTLKPGLLVSLKTSIVGNVSYSKTVLDHGSTLEDGTLKSKWETEKAVADAEEHEKAVKVRGQARSLVSGICANSSFGLLCPDSKAAELEAALRAARLMIDDFNSSSKLSKISLTMLTGRIAQDDVEAARAINSEMQDLMKAMQDGIATLDVNKVRDAANRARGISQMLTPTAQERVQNTIKVAREAAKKIVKASEAVATEIDQTAIDAIGRARTAFLDIDMPHAEIDAPTAEGRAIDLEPEVDGAVIAAQAPKAQAVQIEVE